MKFYELIDESETTCEWYTPEYIFQQLECRFDLDPASPGRDVVPWIPAVEHFTSDGLECEWKGFVWLNAPYGRDVLPEWIEKFCRHGNGITIVRDAISTGWWQNLASHADLILCLNKKIAFVNSERDNKQAAPAGHMLVAIGAQAIAALTAAARNGLGLLVKPTANESGQDGKGNNRRKRTVNDIVYTGEVLPRLLVRHAERYMKPGGFSLDPCKGRGAFYNVMSEPRDWCEIREERDFLDWTQPVALIATNPPWSDVYSEIAKHAFKIGDVVMFLTKMSTALGTYARHRDWLAAGHGLREVILIRWEDADFTNEDDTEKSLEGFVLGAFIWVRGYKGDPHFNYDWLNGIPTNVREVAGPQQTIEDIKAGMEIAVAAATPPSAVKFAEAVSGNIP